MKKRLLCAAFALATAAPAVAQKPILEYDMESRPASMQGLIYPTYEGVDGKATRFDGYTNYMQFEVDDNCSMLNAGFGLDIVCTLESYPSDGHGAVKERQAYIFGNINHEKQSGFAMTVSTKGYYGFEFYADGKRLRAQAKRLLPANKWIRLSATQSNNAFQLYLNGVKVAEKPYTNKPDLTGSTFIVGKNFTPTYTDSKIYELNMFNGIIDHISLYADALDASTLAFDNKGLLPDYSPDSELFKDDILRPKFHAMPRAKWTNETHGLIFYNDKYHLFFQKDPSGPHSTRKYWGHLVSDDMVRWDEFPYAIAPDSPIDFKGVWSGCLLRDKEVTNDKPYIIYTAVNKGAKMAYAEPLDEELREWRKPKNNILIDSKPEGLSKDFRDPYTFKHNDNLYMIVGTSKDNRGATTLHRYDKETKKWSNNGDIFFTTPDSKLSGNFWEMPIIEPIDGDKWILCVTPTSDGDQSQGTEVQYWIGTINDDGTFKPLPKYEKQHGVVEIDGLGNYSYGMLSPSPLRHDGKFYVIGIVPDKLGQQHNSVLGWAHTYCLPREWSLNENDELIQRPYEGLRSLRSETKFEIGKSTTKRAISLDPVEGREFEIELIVDKKRSTGKFGFSLLNGVDLSYDIANNTIAIDARECERIVNDKRAYNGLYTSEMPMQVAESKTFKINVFFDNSIFDIFVNDMWAASVRVYPTKRGKAPIECYTTGTLSIDSCKAWVLK